MIGNSLVFLGVLLTVSIQTNRIIAEPIFFMDFLKGQKMPAMDAPVKELIQPMSNGMANLAGMARSMGFGGNAGNEKPDDSGVSSIFNMLSSSIV